MKRVDNKTLSSRIREEYGTVKHFCKKHGISYHTYKNVAIGYKVSANLEKTLRSEGFIKEDECLGYVS